MTSVHEGFDKPNPRIGRQLCIGGQHAQGRDSQLEAVVAHAALSAISRGDRGSLLGNGGTLLGDAVIPLDEGGSPPGDGGSPLDDRVSMLGF